MTQERKILLSRFMAYQMELEKKMKQKESSWQEELFSKNIVHANDGTIFQIPFSYTRDKMLEYLMRETVDFGRVITYAEFAKIPSVPQPNEYARYGWVSFNEAASEAWRWLQGPTQTHLTEKGKYLCEHPTSSQKSPFVRPRPAPKEQQTASRKPLGPIPRFD